MNQVATPATVATQAGSLPPVRAFDFLTGHWRVSHRKLRSRLTGCTDWETFDSIQQAWPLMGGICNTDESWRLDAEPGQGYIGATFRCLDLKTQLWSIYWVGARDGILGMPPQVGGFDGNVGDFDSDEMIGGQLVRVRFTWTVLSPTTAHWQQGFSLDKGETWEINWTMDFKRISADEYAGLCPAPQH
jgi:hypothetical protein